MTVFKETHLLPLWDKLMKSGSPVDWKGDRAIYSVPAVTEMTDLMRFNSLPVAQPNSGLSPPVQHISPACPEASTSALRRETQGALWAPSLNNPGVKGS